MKHVLPYYFTTTIPTTTGDYPITAGMIGIMNSRPCRILSLTFTYNSPINNGGVISYTIENLAAPNDATVRSPPLLVSSYPRRYTLRNPRSTDFSYIGGSDQVTIISAYESNKASKADVKTFLVGTVVLEFSPSQPANIVAFEVTKGEDPSSRGSPASMISIQDVM